MLERDSINVARVGQKVESRETRLGFDLQYDRNINKCLSVVVWKIVSLGSDSIVVSVKGLSRKLPGLPRAWYKRAKSLQLGEMSAPSTSLLRLTRHASSALPASRSHVATRLFTSSSSIFAGRSDAGGSSSTVDLGARSTGFHAAKDEAGNPIGREPGPLYREWLQSEGKAFKEPRPQETNYLGGSIVEFVLHCPPSFVLTS